MDSYEDVKECSGTVKVSKAMQPHWSTLRVMTLVDLGYMHLLPFGSSI